MTEDRGDALGDDPLDWQLRAVLDVDHAPEFRAHVHARLAAESMRAAWWGRAPMAGVLAVTLGLAAGGALTYRSAGNPSLPGLVPRTAVATVSPPSSGGPPSSPRSEPRHLGGAARRPVSSTNRGVVGTSASRPEILISPDDANGLRVLVSALADEQFRTQIAALSTVAGELEIQEAVIDPIAIPAMSTGAFGAE